ncbi:argininosuccinate lyase [Candidatus Roizmanbacteria bacterium RIFCSPHIGHO2_01_FULL_35_10]|uniref:Argininosuccinate lyase n=1 Tax=Candidatus Roizmanbacteria bacterium RIFCSPLOWO2_01_FULL_35_13 TaxID=1802055 RepID=A0A1F7IAN1_9BACT|nr:MAG: argininosuccinate lyase [Candidatus Roizmanbacteria bacterium RIFCSPHIGHO2_01_FULL_35_10]OGK40402.1 MAG: argininosuccinate lyase [Candidatus Roizmanbacteria bacterium RIFCSPLOWO2_01_FULL_35_13]
MKNSINPFWGEGENKNFGKIAIEYAAGEDVILDKKFVQYECLVNQTHQLMLLKQNILPINQVKKILEVLQEIKKIDKEGTFELKKDLEDVHSNIEKYVLDKLGIEIGGNLRLGIARNDQVYTDTRMYIRDHILFISNQLTYLITGLLNEANKYFDAIMPGYTHLRVSQSITYGHWLTAKAYHFLDDLNNLIFDFGQVNKCPLGIFEMAGTQLPIDRKMTAEYLGFDGITENSLYTANSRGEIEAKLLADLSILALHIKRTMSEIIMWSTHEFGFLKINDLYTTGGTAQPNLKNPDTLEVIRANCVKIYGRFLETLITMDSLPSGFNRDTQQTKPALFESVNIVEQTLPVFSGIMTTLEINKERMAKSAEINFANAPDVAVQIAVKGNVSFREAYKVVKTLIKEKYLKNNFSEITPDLLVIVSNKVLGKKIVLTKSDLEKVSTPKECVFNRTSEGGPAPSQVKIMIIDIEKKVNDLNKEIVNKQNKIKKAIEKLEKSVKKVLVSAII